MALIKSSEDWAVTAEGAARRVGWRAEHELALRKAMEDLLRQRMPDARICHEMVMGAREVRADVVAVGPDHIAAVEVKGEGDDVTRLLHQVGLYQLCVPEVWMVISAEKRNAASLVRYLLPSVGLIVGHNLDPHWRTKNDGAAVRFDIEAEPVPRQPHPVMMAEMMWAQELANICNRTRIAVVKSAKPPRAKMMTWLLDKLTVQDFLVECCTELRARHALWRADPAISRSVEPKQLAWPRPALKMADE